METSIVSAKGQVVVPARIRHRLGMRRGIRVVFIEQDGKLMIQPLDKSYFESLAGILDSGGKMMKSLMDENKERDKVW